MSQEQARLQQRLLELSQVRRAHPEVTNREVAALEEAFEQQHPHFSLLWLNRYSSYVLLPRLLGLAEEEKEEGASHHDPIQE